MKTIITLIIFLLFGCGIGVDVDVKKPIDVNHNHNFNIDGIVDFCNSYAEDDVQQCIDDLSEFFKSTLNDSNE